LPERVGRRRLDFDVTRRGSELGFLFGKHTNDTSSDLVMDNCVVVFANDVNARFLFEEMDIRAE
jgi:hypothetical protein